VLVVEDEMKLAALIQKALREQGLLADTAVRGEEALWMAAATPFDVIVLDVNLPGIDGFETVRRLRGDGIRTASMTGSRGSTPAPMTTWSSRSTSASCSRGSGHWHGGARSIVRRCSRSGI
jgi:CheY-like chemotaxis protein